MMPILTVYVTNYNYGEFIEQALTSLFNQTFQDFEILVIDDGSTDGSKDIIEQYGNHPKVNIIYQQNKGLNVSNNVALRVSKAKYIMRLDADDFLVENALELMVNKLELDDDLGLVFPDYFIVSKKGDVLHKEQRHQFSEEVSMLDQPAHGACTMIRRGFLVELGGYDESFTCQDGYDLWIKFVTNHKVGNINEPLFYYRQHGTNLTKNEDRILSTRSKIKQAYLDNKNICRPNTLLVIPVRSDSFYERRLGQQNLLEIRIREALKAKNVSKIVITSNDPKVKEKIKEEFATNRKVTFMNRESELARYNVDLKETVEHILKNPTIISQKIEVVVITAIEFPFVTSNNIDDTINTIELFKADSIVSVRPENNVMFQHQGAGMKPILNQDKFNKLEREMLYRNTGGILGTLVSTFLEKKNFLGNRVGHIVLSQKEAIALKSEFDFKIAEILIESEMACLLS